MMNRANHTRLIYFTNSLDAFLAMAKDTIPFEQLFRYLPFAVTVRAGNTFRHLVNASVFPIELESRGHVIFEGETLCKRANDTLRPKSAVDDACPGCLHIARGLAAKHVREDAVV